MKNKDKKYTVHGVILSGGSGSRFAADLPKQYVKLAGKTILEHTIDAFEAHSGIDSIIIVVAARFKHLVEDIILRNSYVKISKILIGGDTRMDSSYAAINSISNDDDIILFHDAVRPLVSRKTISDCIVAVKKYQAVDVVIPCTDTIVETADGEFISQIPDRANLRRGLTPQGFKAGLIRKAHLLMKENNDTDFTDDCGIVLKYNLSDVFLVTGTVENIKITYPEDIFIADKLFQTRSRNSPEGNLAELKDKTVVVFGGTKGIGESIIDLANRNGARTYAFSRSNGVNIADPASVENALSSVADDCGKIDFIICTSAVLKTGKLTERSIESLKEEVDINYFGSLYVVKFGTAHLAETHGAFALFTSSSYTRGRALYASYSSIKAAIVNLTQAVAEELSSDNIRINAINPERTATPMRTENFGAEAPETLMTADKVAEETLKTLLSSLTGQVINVNKVEK
ncbi:MAG: 2-C-methyl-D-erythritol 4-phosphate cytidylyltransferase [Emcibacter sp.]|nr:2-C-methyl-D-erythritol 4-phosphate cytidylyltransferase [Emcibacter sp.]